MKKLLILTALSAVLILLLCSCVDFSEQIDSGMDNLNNTLNEALEPVFKEDEKYSENLGITVGKKLPSYNVTVFDGNGVTNEQINPARLGKVTVINFWGLWCGYCLDELPDFDEVASEFGDEITMVAIHSVDSFGDDAIEYVNEFYSDSEIIFAMDVNYGEGIERLDECYETFGGRGYYPHTVIVDENGIITYTDSGVLSSKKLTQLINEALEK